MRKHTKHLGGWLAGVLACSALAAVPALLSNSGAGALPATGSVPTLQGDIPVVGDWDGNGTETIGIFRGGTWYLRNANGPGAPDLAFGWGSPGDVPIVGDWNGDGSDTIGVFRNGTWYQRNTNSPGGVDAAFGWGSATDVPVVGDWNGDGSDTIGVRRSNNYHLRNANNSGGIDLTNVVGDASDITVVGRFDGGSTKTGVRTGTTFKLPSGTGTVSFDYGQPTITTVAKTADEQRLLDLVNAARASAGCPALTPDSRLSAAALEHSRDMANRSYFEHTSPDGITPWSRMLAAGYQFSLAGENIAAGYSNVDAAFNGWMNSAGHRSNILNCSFRNMGLGLVNQPGSPWTYYWTQAFGTL